jgi:hypothetical protein
VLFKLLRTRRLCDHCCNSKVQDRICKLSAERAPHFLDPRLRCAAFGFRTAVQTKPAVQRGFVDLALHNANRHTTINGPAVTVPPLQAKIADYRPSCRTAILDAIDQLHQRTGATQFARRDIVAEVQAAGADFERQTIYRCLRRLTGQEGGGAHRDLEDLGNGQLRLRGD